MLPVISVFKVLSDLVDCFLKKLNIVGFETFFHYAEMFLKEGRKTPKTLK